MKLMSPREAAKHLGVTRGAIYNAIKAGRLTRHEISGRVFVNNAELPDFEKTIGVANNYRKRTKNMTEFKSQGETDNAKD